ncbi:MAG: dephospho-CoA kinase [Parasulfuritortus sp.]|nr:dephospho-CoA kinase [Parasulfuritortus sp.]
MKRPYCVVLTGGVGSGKSLVTAIFSSLGVEIIDTDLVARELTAPAGAAMAPIRDAFGVEYLLADGGLDRRRMRERIFNEPTARIRLEAILHPQIRACVIRRLNDSNAPYVLLVVPLFVESGAYLKIADRVLVVDCDPEQQRERVMQRDGVAEELVNSMLAAQAGREQRLALANDVIDNRGDVTDVEAEVRRLHQVYLGLAENRSRM